jgi:hypothetical protein
MVNTKRNLPVVARGRINFAKNFAIFIQLPKTYFIKISLNNLFGNDKIDDEI